MGLRPRSMTAVAAVAVATIALPLAAPAAAAQITTVASGFVGPLQIAVGSNGTLYVAESFAGKLTAVTDRGRVTVASDAVNGVDARGGGRVVYTTRAGEEVATEAALKRVLPNGRTTTLADLLAFEQSRNPDQVNSYGFQGLPAECAAQFPADVPVSYTGGVDSNPYAVAGVGGGWVVADAGGNDLVWVSANGTVRTLAVLPPQPLSATLEIIRSINSGTDEQGNPNPQIPECAAGFVYNFEPVPTDVELGPDGMLYVTTLPGGPEDPSLGARGSVYRVDPSNGSAVRIGTGFAGATNLAVAPNGDVYVAELFGNRISKLVDGGPQVVVEVPSPAALEWANGRLYASIDVFGPMGPNPDASIVTVTP